MKTKIKNLFKRIFQPARAVRIGWRDLMRPSLFALCLCVSASLRLNAQDVATATVSPTTVSNLVHTAGSGVTQAGTDAVNVFQRLSLTNPVSAGVFGVKNGKNYGLGIDVSSANPNSLVNVGFALLALPNASSHKIDFYDATLNLSISTVEKIPVLNIPITLKVESGPAFRLSRGGNTLLEQSAAFGDVTFDWIKHFPITIGGGVIHCSAFSGALPMAHINTTFLPPKWMRQ